MSRAIIVLKILLWFICLSHIVIGGGIMLSSDFQHTMAAVYGASVNWTEELSYLLRVLGVFMLALGVVGLAAAIDPLRYRVLIFGFAGVLLVRVAQRIVFQQDIHDAFGLETGRMVINGAFFATIALALIVLLILAQKQAQSEDSA